MLAWVPSGERMPDSLHNAELGFAIGLLFYLGTTIAGCMYVLGAVEAFQTAFSMKDQFAFDTQVEALALMLVLTCVVIIGACPRCQARAALRALL